MTQTTFPIVPIIDDYADTIEQSIYHRTLGSVSAVIGHRIEVKGMNIPIGAICNIVPTAGTAGLTKVVGFNGDHPVLSAMDELQGVSVGDRVELVSVAPHIKVGPQLLGRVVDALGRPLDSHALPASLGRYPAQLTPPASLERPPIDTAFETGVRAIDSMLTCGVGQRMGIFSGAGVGKSTLLGMLARHTRADAVVIGLVGERGREVREFIEQTLGEAGMRRSAIVVSTNDQPAAMRIQAAWTATAIASALRESGKHVVLLLDSVSRFATAQREIGLAAGEPPTTRGYPPSVFAQLPKLLEITGKTQAGSITAFYSVLVDGDDNNEPISDAIRGLLDGHIILNRQLASQGHLPAIDILESLSRLQSKLLPRASIAACTQIRDWMSTYASNQDLINIGAYRAGSNADIDKAIEMQKVLRKFFQQSPSEQSSLALTLQQLNSIADSAGD